MLTCIYKHLRVRTATPDMSIRFSADVLRKLLGKHGVTQREVLECFANSEGIYLQDLDEDHATDPPTFWFMAPTDRRRLLKICFVRRGSVVHIKTAFSPTSARHAQVYRQLAGLPPFWPHEEE